MQGASVVVVRGLSSFDSKGSRTHAQYLRRRVLVALWHVGTQPVSPALAGGFFTFEPLGVCESESVNLLSHVHLIVTPGTVVHKAPLSMEFSRQSYWSGLPFLSPGDKDLA